MMPFTHFILILKFELKSTKFKFKNKIEIWVIWFTREKCISNGSGIVGHQFVPQNIDKCPSYIFTELLNYILMFRIKLVNNTNWKRDVSETGRNPISKFVCLITFVWDVKHIV
jgi:hypothetical protein